MGSSRRLQKENAFPALKNVAYETFQLLSFLSPKKWQNGQIIGLAEDNYGRNQIRAFGENHVKEWRYLPIPKTCIGLEVLLLKKKSSITVNRFSWNESRIFQYIEDQSTEKALKSPVIKTLYLHQSLLLRPQREPWLHLHNRLDSSIHQLRLVLITYLHSTGDCITFSIMIETGFRGVKTRLKKLFNTDISVSKNNIKIILGHKQRKPG